MAADLGATIIGPDFPGYPSSGATVVDVESPTQVELADPGATAPGAGEGFEVVDDLVAPGTTIASASGSSVTLSAPAQGTGTGALTVTGIDQSNPEGSPSDAACGNGGQLGPGSNALDRTTGPDATGGSQQQRQPDHGGQPCHHGRHHVGWFPIGQRRSYRHNQLLDLDLVFGQVQLH